MERKLIDAVVPLIPSRILSHHLTMLTLVWSLSIIGFGYLSEANIAWIHGVSVMVALQWVTDSLDGSLGKFRKQGLVKWGFFMDHFLDLLFAGSVVIAYSFLVEVWWLKFLIMVLLLVTSGMMAVTFLSFATTNRFQVSYYGFGPTEVRIGYIVMNTIVYYWGTAILSWGLPVVLVANIFGLAHVVRETSEKLWAIDYEANLDGAPR